MSENTSANTSNKTKKGLKPAIIVIAVVAAIYILGGLFFSSHFYLRSTVNGLNAGFKSASKVYEELVADTADYTLAIVQDDGYTEAEYNATSLGVEVSYTEDDVKEALTNQNGFLWPMAIFKSIEYVAGNGNSYDEDAIYELASNLDLMRNEGIESADAYIDFNGSEFEIVEEVYGDEIDADNCAAAIISAIENMETMIYLSDGACYKMPAVLATDEDINKAVEKLNKFLAVEITYDLNGEATEQPDVATRATWFKWDEDFNTSFDEDAINEFISEMSSKYNTAGQSKTLEASSGETVTVPAGSYGWKIDAEGELEQIKTDIKSLESVTRDFVYESTANTHIGNDYGDSYVEVNLTEQHVYVYKDGELVVSTDCVTGNVFNNCGTHTGAYAIAYKQKDATLRGDDYESHVNYWMPFHNGEGLHDATWRSKFGGTIYQGNGSHGCVNLPLSAAKSIYEVVDAGWPVLVFYTGNTEAEIYAANNPYIDCMNTISEIETVTLASESLIASARAKYDALSAEQKALVTNYDHLVEAEATLATMKAQWWLYQ